MTKILCFIPPHIPSYFNAGHHLYVFLVASYLQKNYPDIEIHVEDGAALNMTWKEVCDRLIKQYDIIFTMFDYDSVDTCDRFIYYVKSISPQTKLVAFGRLVKEIPAFFINKGFDAAHYSGDFECGAESYLNYFLKGTPYLGLMTSAKLEKTIGDTLPPEKWVMPNVKDIPYEAYHHLYKNDFNKFCGIPNRQELVVPIARGCPVGCYYCDVPKMQGLRERRLSVEDTLHYIETSFATLPFEYFTFYAPTFTLNKQWVLEFCEKIIALNKNYAWKCVTVLKTLTPELLTRMAEAGCVRVSFGIESFSKEASNDLPKVKQDSLTHFQLICQTASKLGVEINVFLILGLTGDTPEKVKETFDACLEEGIRIRPTLYTPYDRLTDEMDVLAVSSFNRQLFIPNLLEANDAKSYYDMFYNNEADKATSVMNKIAVRQ